MEKICKGTLVILLVTSIFIIPISAFEDMEKSRLEINDCDCNQNHKASMLDDSVALEHERFWLFHNLRFRSYLVHVPPNYDGSEPMAVVITLHGGPNTAENSSLRFGVSEKADEEGFIAVYADGACKIPSYRYWNAGYCCWLADEFKIDDVGFIRKMIEKLQNDFTVDPDRIYVAGHSNGAMLAYRLGAELSDIIAGVASNAGAIGGYEKSEGEEPDPLWQIPEAENPISVVIFHSTFDRVVPYDGGYVPQIELYSLSVADAVSFWINCNGCNPDPQIYESEDGKWISELYTNGDTGSEVLCYTIKYGGHIWFGGHEWEDPLGYISTTDRMWDFFEAHPKQ